MKTIFVIVSWLIGACVLYGAVVVLVTAANGISPALDALTAAVNAYPSAAVGRLLGDVIVAKWQVEIAKLMFWIHLFS